MADKTKDKRKKTKVILKKTHGARPTAQRKKASGVRCGLRAQSTEEEGISYEG